MKVIRLEKFFPKQHKTETGPLDEQAQRMRGILKIVRNDLTGNIEIGFNPIGDEAQNPVRVELQ